MSNREPLMCTANDVDDRGVGRCACSLVTATGGKCGVFGPPPTFAEAFPYLDALGATESSTGRDRAAAEKEEK